MRRKKSSEKNIISVDITCMPSNCKACHVLSVNRIIFLKLKEAQIGLSLIFFAFFLTFLYTFYLSTSLSFAADEIGVYVVCKFLVDMVCV